MKTSVNASLPFPAIVHIIAIVLIGVCLAALVRNGGLRTGAIERRFRNDEHRSAKNGPR